MSHRRSALRMLATGAVLVAGAACHDSSGPVGPDAALQPSVPDAARVTTQGPSGGQAALAQTVTGFGGLFLDEHGTPTVYLTDLAQQSAAQAAVAAVAAQYEIPGSQLRVLKGDFSYQQLDAWFSQASQHAMTVPGAVFADLDEASNRVRIGVENAPAAAAVKGLLARLNIPSNGVIVEQTAPIRNVATLQDKVRAVRGGLQINFPGFLCTLGFNATSSGGQRSFITNSHCTAIQGGVQSTPYNQPLSTTAGSFIGTEVADPNYFTGGACPASRRCRFSDSSRGKYASAPTSVLGRIARTTSRGQFSGSLTISSTNPTFSITAERANSLVGQTVNKMGRTTGWTFGKITNACVTVNVSGTDITQLCQNLVSAGVGPGDSGSPVFNWSGSGSHVTLAGILWGGSSNGRQLAFSPMSGIESELGALTTF